MILGACLSSAGAQPQNIGIDGTIYSNTTKEPLSFSHIFIKHLDNSLIGTISDVNGEFRLRIPIEYILDTLAVSYLGHEQLAILIDTLETTTGLLIYLPESET